MNHKEFLDQTILEQNLSEQRDRSDKLTAGYLYQSKRFQLLKHLGVKEKPIDVVTAKRFRMGKMMEKMYVEEMRWAEMYVDEQIEVVYKGVKGVLDLMCDHSNLGDGHKIIPHEVKSTGMFSFKMRIKEDEMARSAILQGCLYALATEKKYFSIDLLKVDMPRDEFIRIYPTEIIAPQVEQIIADFNKMIKNHEIPVWEVAEDWMNNPLYMAFDESWATCTNSQFKSKLKKLKIKW